MKTTRKKTEAPIKEVRRRFTYVKKEELTLRSLVVLVPSHHSVLGIGVEQAKRYSSAYWEGPYMEFIKGFADHPINHTNEQFRNGDLDNPKDPNHQIYVAMVEHHNEEHERRQKLIAELGPEPKCGEPGYGEWHDKNEVLRASFVENNTLLEVYEDNRRRAMERWQFEHRAECTRHLDEWVSRNEP